jgi:hypothetical protein
MAYEESVEGSEYSDDESDKDESESGFRGPRVDFEKVAKVRRLFYKARDHRRPMLDRWIDNYEITHNRVWQPNRQAWVPSPKIAEIWPTINALVAWETDVQPSFDVVPLADPNGPYSAQLAQVANDLRICLRSAWFQNNFDAELQKILWDGKVYGTGISKVVWDTELADGLGDVKMRRVDPFWFYPDPSASDMRDGRFYIEVYELSEDELESRFPGACEKVGAGGTDDFDRAPTLMDSGSGARPPKANPGPISGTGGGMEYGLPGQGRHKGRDVESETHFVIEAWTKDDENEWYVCIVTGNTVLLEGPATSLWGHGQHPYDRYVPIETGEFWGMALVEFLAPIQKSINRLLSAMEHNIWLVGNPVLLEDSRSGLQRTRITNKPGQRLTVNSGTRVEWMNPPQMQPQMAMQLVNFYVGEIERISGLSAIVRGATPTGRNAQGVLDSVQEAAFVRTRLALRNLEFAMKGAGEKCAALIAEFYDEPRVVALVAGPSGGQLVQALGGKHFYVPTEQGTLPIRFQLQVQAGSSITTSRSARMAEADTLFAMGAIDEEAVLQAHDFPNWQMVVDRVREMKAANGTLGEPPGARAAAGRTS